MSRGSVAVYGMALLLATAAQLEPRFGNSLRLPDDIVPLVEGSYAVDPTLPEPWLKAHRAARIKQDEVEDTRRATARSMVPGARPRSARWVAYSASVSAVAGIEVRPASVAQVLKRFQSPE